MVESIVRFTTCLKDWACVRVLSSKGLEAFDPAKPAGKEQLEEPLPGGTKKISKAKACTARCMELNRVVRTHDEVPYCQGHDNQRSNDPARVVCVCPTVPSTHL